MNAPRHPVPISALCGILLLWLAVGSAAVGEIGASCPHCGMEKAKFGHSWMEIVYDDGSVTGFCSVHCAALDMALNIDKAAVTTTVGDYRTEKPIDAEKAFWVIGGDRPGVMTTRAKWAFEDREAADAFVAEHGGVPADFERVVRAAFEDMHEDIRMIHEKRKRMRMRRKSEESGG